jgi:TetR/AcrR family transcriptional regulator
MGKIDNKTEETILEAAKRVFHEHGLAGARMQQIADEAGINKALLHYYFRNKDRLFKAVFLDGFTAIIPKMNEIFDADIPLLDKIRTFADRYITLVSENPYLPGFIIQEMNNNPNFATEYLSGNLRPNPSKLLDQIQREVDAGNIIPIEPVQLVINLMAMCIFPFTAAQMIKGVTGASKKQFDLMMERRKKDIPEFIINAINPRP